MDQVRSISHFFVYLFDERGAKVGGIKRFWLGCCEKVEIELFIFKLKNEDYPSFLEVLSKFGLGKPG